MSAVLWCNISADDFIFQDIQQKLDKKKINDVELTKVLETPSLFKNSTIRFEAKFAQIGNLSRVFHTKYDLSEYLNLAVWPDEVKLWQKDGLKVFSPLVFVKKSSNNATVIGKLKKYQRVQITGLVTNDYQNQPWIEVLAIKVLDKEALSEEALYHIRLGDKYHYGDHPGEPGAEKATQSNIGIDLAHAEIEYQKSLTYELGDVEKSAVLELLGEVQLKQGKVEASIASLTATLDINSKSGRANHLMAQAQLAAGNLEQAKIYGEKALDTLSKNKDVLLCNARILIKLKNYELAKAHCINANRLDADDIRPYAYLGEIYDALNEYDVSKEMYRRAINLKDGVDNFELHKNMGHALLKIALVEKNAKEKENALMQADREFNATVNQINDKNPEAYYLWGRVLEEWKSRPKSEVDSIDKFDKAIALDPKYFNAHMHKASVLNYRLNKPKEAIDSYENASKLRPDDLSPLKALDKIYREAKNYEKTVSVNTRIVAIEPKNFSANFALGMDNHLYLNQQAIAADWFTKAMAIDMKHSEVDFYLGKSLYLSGKKVEAIKHLLNAAVKLPGEKMVSFYLGKAYSDTDQSAKAIENLVKYNGLDAQNVETRVLLSKEYLRNPKTVDAAIKTAAEAVDLAEKQKTMQGDSYDAHGWALAMGNQSQKALGLLEKANKDNATNERQYHLGYVYVQNEMYVEADAVLKKLEALELDKRLAADVKRLRADLENRLKSAKEKTQKASTEKEVKATQPEKKPEPEKKKEPVKIAESDKKKADPEAEKNQKLEEQKRIENEKRKKELADKLAKEEKIKEKEREAAAKEEAEKKRKDEEAKAKNDKKLAEQKAEEDAKKKKADEKAQKEKEAKLAEDKKAEEKKSKELAKQKEEQDKKAKEDAKLAEEAKAKADKAKKEQAKVDQEKLAKEKAAQEKKAKEDAKLAEEAKVNAEKAKKEQAKADQEKLAKEKAAQEKKAKEEAKAKAEQDKAAQAAKEKADKEKAEKEKQEKELAAKKAKEEEKAKAEDAKKAKALAEQAKKEQEAKNQAALIKEKEDKANKEKAAKEEAKKAEAEKKKKAEEEKKKAEELEKKKEEEKAAALKLAEEKKKLAEKARRDAAKAQEEAEKLEKERKKDAEKK